MDFNLGFSKRLLSWPQWDHWFAKAKPRLYGSGRAAFIDVLSTLVRVHQVKRVWIPNFLCAELPISIRKAVAIDIHVYDVGADLLPLEVPQGGQDDAIILVDYFASPDGEALESLARNFVGFVLFDCVHSWPAEDLRSSSWPERFVLIGGFRKLFWKCFGAFVMGHVSKDLPLVPCFIRDAAPGFPRNLSLSPRWGILSLVMTRILNYSFLDDVAKSWGTGPGRAKGLLAGLRCPVQISSRQSAERPLSDWPDLWKELPPSQLESAEFLKKNHLVCWRSPQ